MAKSFSIFATTCFLLVAFASHCYAVTCVTLDEALKPPTVVAKRTFDNGATLGDSPNTLERVYVNGRSIDEPLLAAIDGDSDEFLNTNKNTTNGVNIVDAEYYYLSNRLGSISAILDADNQDRILEYYRYEVFGSATVLPIVDNNTDGLEDTPLDLNDNNASGPALVSSFGNTYLYTARRFDDVTSLYYYRNRYYDPRSGRFITRDPLGYVNAPNFYHFVGHRVNTHIDPLGTTRCKMDDMSSKEIHDFLREDVAGNLLAGILTSTASDLLNHWLDGTGATYYIGWDDLMSNDVVEDAIDEYEEKAEDRVCKKGQELNCNASKRGSSSKVLSLNTNQGGYGKLSGILDGATDIGLALGKIDVEVKYEYVVKKVCRETAWWQLFCSECWVEYEITFTYLMEDTYNWNADDFFYIPLIGKLCSNNINKAKKQGAKDFQILAANIETIQDECDCD